jgi:di/tricarboxylate transporter
MADKQIKVKVDVETNAGKSIADLKELKKQLKQVAVGSADFKKLSAEIRDVEDAIEGAKLGAEDLAGSLEAAPGPIGEIFKGLKKVEIATKSWGAALKATGIGLLVSLVGAFAAALSKSDETMKKFERNLLILVGSVIAVGIIFMFLFLPQFIK